MGGAFIAAGTWLSMVFLGFTMGQLLLLVNPISSAHFLSVFFYIMDVFEAFIAG